MSVEPLEAFQESARSVAAAAMGMPTGSRWHIHCDTDADGLSSAAIVASVLTRLGHRFQVRASRDKTGAAYGSLFAEDADAYMVLDKGTSHLDVLSEGAQRSGRPVVVIDHHSMVQDAVPEGVHLLNPRRHGLDGGRDACSSTSAVAFAVAALGEEGFRHAPTGLVGAIGDWQHGDGWHGWNRIVVEKGVEAGYIIARDQPTYIGMELADAIARWPEPDLPGLSGDRKAAHAFLQSLSIPDTGDAAALDTETRTRLTTGLVLHGLAEGVAPEDLARMVRLTHHHAALDMELRHVFRTVDACGREGAYGTGIAFLMGDKAARREADALYETYRNTLRMELRRLHEEGPESRPAMQRFSVERPAYTGMVAGLGMTVVVRDHTRPMVVTAPRPDGDVQVSTRGTPEQVAAGLDLGRACHTAGEPFGREGGGHPVAAGIVVSPDDLEPFLDALDEALILQGFLEALQ